MAEEKKRNSESVDPLEIARGIVRAGKEDPKRRRYIVNDFTVEKLGELLRDNPNGLLAYRDELVGLLKSLDKSDREEARAFMLEAWGGTGTFVYDRIGRGTVDISAAIISVLGSVQPEPLGKYLKEAVSGEGGADGLMQRFQLMVYPDVPRTWENIDRWPNSAARQGAHHLFERLNGLQPEQEGAQHEDGCDIPFLRFDDEAQETFDRWRGKLERRLRSGREPDYFASHLAKYRSLIPSLALLIHLAENSHGPVRSDTLEKAIGWGEHLEANARCIYASAVGHRGDSAARALAEHILAGDLVDGFTLRDVYRHHWAGLATADCAREAVAVLIDLDWLREVREKTSGKPRVTYDVNPRVREGGAE